MEKGIVMSKMRMLEQGSYSAITEIVPYPDFKIAFTTQSGRSVLVECPEQRRADEVIEFVQKQKGGSWLMGLWSDGESNPYQNPLGVWVWLLVRP